MRVKKRDERFASTDVFVFASPAKAHWVDALESGEGFIFMVCKDSMVAAAEMARRQVAANADGYHVSYNSNYAEYLTPIEAIDKYIDYMNVRKLAYGNG